MKKLIIIGIIIAVVSIIAIPATLFADPPEKVDGFVCPVFKGDKSNNPNAFEIGEGDWTLVPSATTGNSEKGNNGKASGGLKIPEHATNGNGSGLVGGSHADPGDSDYTAIWNAEIQ